MDDIDDYFDDDLVLDEQTLAILDREEKKYLSQVQRQPPPPPAVTKKQKTRSGWSPGVGSRPRDHDFDDLPEISITVDGSYGFTDSALTSTPSNPSQPPPRQTNQPNAFQTTRQNLPDGRVLSRLQPVVPPSRPLVSTIQNRAAPVFNPQQQISNQNSSVSSGAINQPDVGKQLAELHAQLCELRTENQKIQEALKEATDIRYVKEGEVSILRKNIEKTAQNHAAEIAKMKVAKEEADAKQKQMERQMKEEAERLKAQFMFKQHELETSLRRPPSARTTRVMKNAPLTPVRVPREISAWTDNLDTPRRHPSLKPSPRATRIGRKSPEVAKKSAFLPGFQNSFVSTPLKLGTNLDSKGKGRDLGWEESIEFPHHVASQRVVSPAVNPVHQRSTDNFDFEDSVDIVPSSDDPIPHIDEDGDSVMLDDNPGEVVNEVEPIESLNLKAELSRIILTHTHAPTGEATFQLLIGLPFIANMPDTQGKQCTRASQAILLALSNPVDDADYEICSRQIANSLIGILRALLGIDPCLPAVALLNLLRSLTLSLPNFIDVLLSRGPEGEEDSLFLATLFDMLDHLPANPSVTSTKEIFILLEAVLSRISDKSLTRIALIPKRISSLLTLLNGSESTEALESLSRIFLLLATYSPIHVQLSTSSDDGSRPETSTHRDSSLVHQLCTYLLDSFSIDFTQIATIHSNLLGCLAQLSLTQAERLVRSNIVIPALTYLIAQFSMALWNNDEYNPTKSRTRSMIRFINQCLFLLHHLVRSSEPIIRFLDKLQHSSHRNLNNLVHMFVVSFGQLSYADPPDWLDAEGKAELECLVDTARDLLDLAVDGPEGDSVWAAYQTEPDNESETDDEEREARLMDKDIQT